MKSIEALFTPADFATLQQRDLSNTMCVVFDVLRATSSMITALANGAAGVVPVEEIAEAISYRQTHPDVLLAGERQGVRIRSGSTTFDLGNSPREFVAAAVSGRTVVMTTTNGTRALRACAKARTVLAASFLNLAATAEVILQERPGQLLLVCSGTYEEAALEDVLGAGALSDLVWDQYADGAVADSALIARKLWLQGKSDLLRALSESRNGRRLLAMPELRDDVSYCLQCDRFPLIAEQGRDGMVRKRRQ
jgi:2-phosphosulfolactate phosphatase